MGRRSTESFRSIRTLCLYYELDEDEIYERSKKLLSAFRRICWNIIERADGVREDLLVRTSSENLDEALIYLVEFAPDVEREFFESHVAKLIKDRYLMKLAEMALCEVRRFPDLGETYYTILKKGYFDSEKHSENDMLDIVNLERSRYYDRKREAVLLFGTILWGAIIQQSDKVRTKVQ